MIPFCPGSPPYLGFSLLLLPVSGGATSTTDCRPGPSTAVWASAADSAMSSWAQKGAAKAQLSSDGAAEAAARLLSRMKPSLAGVAGPEGSVPGSKPETLQLEAFRWCGARGPSFLGSTPSLSTRCKGAVGAGSMGAGRVFWPMTHCFCVCMCI